MSDPTRFYTETVPAQWNAALDAQELLGAGGRELLEDLRAVDATIRVDVTGEGGGRFFLNVRTGRMAAGDRPDHPPLLTLIQDRAGFERLASEAEGSALGLLGSLSGLGGAMHLTRTRVANLRALRGLVHFEVTGDDGFALRTHFGAEPPPDSPDASIRVDPATYRELRAGRLDPPRAFLEGRIEVEGDVQLTMQLALAAIAPD